MKSVVVFIPALSGGGAQTGMVRLVNGLAADSGLRVTLAVANGRGPLRSSISEDVLLVDFGMKRTFPSLFRLTGLLRSLRPDALLTALTHANMVGLLASWLASISGRVVVSERNTLSSAIRDSFEPVDRLLARLIPFAYDHADTVIAVSRGVAQDLIETAGLDPALVRVVYNPILTADLFENARVPVQHPWFDDPDISVILGVGRLEAQKDFQTLIRAFASVRPRLNVRLMILGEGSDRPRLENLVHELGVGTDVSMPGFVENPHAYMRAASVFALSSRYEGMPNALVEALAVGTPVVATDCPNGPREVLADGDYGRLVPVGNSDALSRALSAALREGFRGVPEHVLDPFSVDSAVSGYRDALGV